MTTQSPQSWPVGRDGDVLRAELLLCLFIGKELSAALADPVFLISFFCTGGFLFVFLYGVSRRMFVVGDERSQFVRDFEGISAVARICDIFYKEVSA